MSIHLPELLESRVLMSVAAPASHDVRLLAAGERALGIALIDAALPDRDLLAQSLPAGVAPVVYDSAEQSPEQVLRLAAGTADRLNVPLQSLMIFSHGASGAFDLGNGVVTADALRGPLADAWRALAGRFTDGATIDVFACDAAAGPTGQALLDRLYAVTGAAVLGSTNITGRDGDWTLEAQSHGGWPATAPVLSQSIRAYPADLLLSLSAPPTATPSPVGGTTTNLSVAFLDVGGSPVITWAVTAKPTGASVSFSSNAATTASSTVATFNKAGSYTFNVTAYDPVLNVSLGSSVSVTVNQTLTSVSVTPGATTLGLNGTQQFSAVALDQFGTAMATQPTLTWSRTGVGSVTASGLYTAPASAGSATVTATTGGTSGSATVTVAATGPTVATPAAASPSTVTGTSTALTVLGADTAGESTLTYTWAATTKPTGATVALTANGTNAAKATTATFNRAGVYVMTATISDGTSSVTSATTITVTPSLATVNVAPSTTTVNENAAQQFTAVGYDQFGNALSAQPTFTWTTAAGSVGSVSATGLYTAPATTGTATVRATSGGITGAAAVTVANATPTVATAAAATTVSVLNTSILSVLGADDGGESNLTYTWAATAQPAGATPTFLVNGTNGAKNTTATFDKAGTYTLTATITDAGGQSTTSSVTVTVAATATTLAVSPLGTVNLNENGTQQLTATVLDQFGAALPVQPAVTYSVNSGGGTVSSGGLFTAPPTTGTSIVHVASGLLGTDVTVNVTDAAPTVVTPATASPALVTGTTATLNALGADDGGESNLTYTWTATAVPVGGAASFSASGTNAAKATTVTFTSAGVYTLRVAISDGAHTTTSSTVVTVAQSVASLDVVPPAAPLHENQTQQFAATAYDQFNHVMVVQPVITWAKSSGLGTITATGLYTAPGAAGTATVDATDGTIHGLATVTVTNLAPVVTVPAAAAPSSVVGNTTLLTVAATDDGGPANLTYTWSATAKPVGSNPAFTLNGTAAAAATAVTFDAAGSYTFAVAVSDGTNTTTSTVAVTVAQTLTAITVTSPSSTAPENGGVQLTATALDQFGAALAVQPAFTWSTTGVGASVTATGLLTASPLPGVDVVTAGVNGSPITGAASITISNTAPTVVQPASAGQSIVTGTQTNLSVLAADDGGESNLTYTWAATVAPVGAHPTFSPNASNGAKNASVTFDTAGAYVLTATVSDGANTMASSVPLTVVQALSGITVTPATASVHLNAAQQFNAVGTDQFGDAMLVQPAFAWSDAGAGSITPTGLYTSGATAGTGTVMASSGGVTGTATVTVTDAAPAVVVPATAAQPTVTGTNTLLTVLGADDAGEPNLTYTWAATSAPAGSTVTFDRNGTNAAKAAIATFDRAGTYVLTASVSDGTTVTLSSVTVTVAQTVSAVAVTPGTASVSLNGTRQFAATVTDQFGQPMAVAPTVTWAVLGTGSVNSAGAFTAANVPGGSTVTATAAGVTGTAAVTIANATPTVATAAAVSANPVTGTTVGVSVLGADDGGEAGLTYTWSVTSAPGGALPLFGANGTHGARNTTVTLDTAGTYTLRATIRDAGGQTATSDVTFTAQQTLTGIAVAPVATMVSLNGTRQFTAVAADQFGNPMATQPTFAWSVASGNGTVDATGLYTAPATVGTATVTAASGGVSGSGVVRTVGAATILGNVSAAATSADLSVVGLGDPSLAVTWSATGVPAGAAAPTFTVNGNSAAQNTTATFAAAGTYTLQAVVNGATLTDTVTVAQNLTSIAVSPTSATMNERATQLFAAVGYDQFNSPMLVQPAVTWAVTAGSGSINAVGLYRAPAAAGPAQVAATSGGVTGTAAVTVTNAIPTVVVAPLAVTNPVLTTTAALSVLGADDGGESNLTYTWSATGTNPAGVTFSANGGNAAKNTTVTFAKAGTYALAVDVSDGTNTVTAPLTVTVTPVLTRLALGPATASLNENGTVQLTAAAYDQFGDPMPTLPPVAFAVASGGGTVDGNGLYTAAGTAGTATVQATVGALQAATTVTVANALPVLSQPATAATGVVTGTGTNVSVLATDDGGASGLTYTWAVTAAPAGASPTFSVNGTPGAASTAVTFDRAGVYTLLATISDGTNTITSSTNVTVQQTATAVAVSPAVAALDENATQVFAATVADQFGQAMSPQPAVTWAVASGVGSIDAGGTYSSGTTVGPAVVRATAAGVSGVAVVAVTNAAPTIATAAAAGAGPVTGTGTTLSVLGADDGGAANLTYTWAATAQPAGATITFAANGTNAAQSDAVTFSKAGDYTLAVAVSDGTGVATSTVNVAVDQTLTAIQITPAGGTTVDENAPLQFTAIGLDQFGDTTVVAPAVDWAVTGGGGSIDASGRFTAGGTPGTTTVEATAAGGGPTQTVTITTRDALPTISVGAAASPADVTGTTTSLSVLGADDGGEANLTYTWAMITGPAGANPTFDVNGTNAAKDAVVTFDRAGLYTFGVAVSDGAHSLTDVVPVTVEQTLSSIAVTPVAATLNANGAQQFTATALDRFGDPLAVQPTVTWAVTGGTGSVDANGVYTAPAQGGAATVQATVGGVTGLANVAINYVPPTVATAAMVNPSAVTGTTAALSVLGASPAGESLLTYTWAMTAGPAGASPAFSANGTNAAKDATVTFDRAGTYAFAVSIGDGFEVTTSSVSVTVSQTMAGVSVSPGNGLVHRNETRLFTTTATDQFGNPMATQPAVTWSTAGGGGTIDATGLYTAPGTDGTATVTATVGGLTTDVPVTVTNATPTLAAAATANPAVVTGTTTGLSVLGADDAGEPFLTYTWAMTAGPAGAEPTFDANGTNAAKDATVTFDAAGSYTFTVTISDGTQSLTSAATVTVAQTATGVAVAPGAVRLNDGQSQQFTAVVDDQFGHAIATAPAVVWSLANGAGTMDATGVYTAAGPDGYTTVQATAGAASGAAAVTVVGAAPTVARTASADPSPAEATTTAVHVLGASPAGESNLTYTWAMTAGPVGASPAFSANGTNAAKDATVTFDRAGTYTFAVTISDGIQSVVSTTTLTVDQVLRSLSVSPGTATLNTYEKEQFTAVGYDQFGDAMDSQPQLYWAIANGDVGTVSSGGIYSSATDGTATVVATTGSVAAQARVTVRQQPPVISGAPYADAAVVTTTGTGLHVAAAQPGFTAGELTYVWTKVAGTEVVMFGDNDSQTAGDTNVTFHHAGNYTFQVTVEGPNGLTAKGTVSVQVDQTLTTLTANARPDTISGTGTAQGTVEGEDQFGDEMAPAGVTWSLDDGSVGSIDGTTGLYDNLADNGTAVLRATGGGLTSTCTVTSTGNVTALTVSAAADQPSVDSQAGMLHANSDSSSQGGPVTYTWSIVDQPTAPTLHARKHELSAALSADAAPLAVFPAINGTAAAADCPVTFLSAGNYTFRVTASDGVHTATSTVDVSVTNAAAAAATTTVAGLVPIVHDDVLTGYTVTFNNPLDPVTASDVRGYRMVRETQVLRGRTAWQHLFGTHTGSRPEYQRLPLASAVYDPATLTVTLTLAKPTSTVTSRLTLTVLGDGPHAVRAADGSRIDGDNNDRAGGTFRNTSSVFVNRTGSFEFPDGDRVNYGLLGPGQVIFVLRGNNHVPIVYLHGCDPSTSVLYMHLTPSRRGAADMTVAAVVNSATALTQISGGLRVAVYR